MNDEPVAYWRLGEPGAGGVAKDETSHGHDGQYSGPGVAFGTAGALAGDVDTAVTFVDGSAKITMPTGIDFDGVKPFTVELWFRASSMNTQVGYIVDHAQYTPVRTGWTVRVGDSANFERWVNDSTVDAIGKPAPVDGQWHHLVAVFDGAQQPAQQYLYLDGRQSDVGGGDHALPPLGAPFTVGRQNCTCAGNNTAFIGDLDELAIYDKALTLPAIQQHYAAAGRQ